METLPLFEELPADEAIAAPTRSRARVDRHLAAARRLAKAMRRLPERSAEQTQAGQAICRHLIALLEESE